MNVAYTKQVDSDHTHLLLSISLRRFDHLLLHWSSRFCTRVLFFVHLYFDVAQVRSSFFFVLRLNGFTPLDLDDGKMNDDSP